MKKKILAFVLMLVLAFTVCACDDSGNTSGGGTQTSVPNLTEVDSDNAAVRMSVLYASSGGDNTVAKNSMRFVSNSYGPYNSIVDGKRYAINDFKPAWAQLQQNLKFTITDVTNQAATSISDAYNKLASNFSQVNLMSGPVASIINQGVEGNFIDLKPYIDAGYMPNLKKFLDDNEIARDSVTTGEGAIYYTPYCDGFDDVETMFICRVDWVRKLLDDNSTYDTATVLTPYYNSYYDTMNTTFTAAKSATETQSVTLSYAKDQGIIDRQNALGTKNGVNLVNELKSYIKTHYIDTGIITKASDLFIGQNACYNADELIALWRCVYTNPLLLTGASTPVAVFYPRDNGTDRTNAICQLAQLWGVRGYDSRNSYFYIDENGNLADSRTNDEMFEALTYLNQLYKEGLILQDYKTSIGQDDFRKFYNRNNRGFMTYDYNQTTTLFNETYAREYDNKGWEQLELSPILFPVADWDNKATGSAADGYSVTANNALYQYTESWRSVKTEGWTITTHTASDLKVLKKCIEIMDYMYTEEGQRLMTYGPDTWLAQDVDGNGIIDGTAQAVAADETVKDGIVYINYRGGLVPKTNPKALNEMDTLSESNYTNYYRHYVGATLPLGYVKLQGMEYQTVDEVGKIGLDYINNALELGTLKHATTTTNLENSQNVLVPTTFSLNRGDRQTIATNCAQLEENFNNSSKDGKNIFHDYIMKGFGVDGNLSAAALKNAIINDWGGSTFLNLYQTAYALMRI